MAFQTIQNSKCVPLPSHTLSGSPGEERHVSRSEGDHYVLRPSRLLGCWSQGTTGGILLASKSIFVFTCVKSVKHNLCVCVCVCVQPYPAGWNLPGGGAQRGNVLNLNGAGDPLTPGYPAKGACAQSLYECLHVCEFI